MAGQNLTRTTRPGTALKRTGVALIAAGMMFFALAPMAQYWPTTWPEYDDYLEAVLVWGYVLSFPILALGGFLFWRGRQYAAQAHAENVFTASKTHVLYLRNFRADSSLARVIISSMFWREFLTEEEQLADVLRPFGDLVAIGRPGERLPTPGAARIYTSDEEWKDVVKRQMQAAQLVVIRADVREILAHGGENLFWELTQAVKTLNPQKLLILLLNMKVKDYESFRARANSILNVPLPELGSILDVPLPELGYWPRISGFFGFAADWKPSFFALKTPFSRFGSVKARFKYALKPVFESFGLEWQPPPVSAKVWFLIGGLAFVPLTMVPLGLYFFYVDTHPATDVFKDLKVRTAWVQANADGCVLTIIDARANADKVQVAKWCKCYASEAALVVNVQELEALERGQVPDSFREKSKKISARCTRIEKRGR